MSVPAAHTPTQAAEFSGGDKHAIVLYVPTLSEAILAVLRLKPTAYEAAWRYEPDGRAHVLEVTCVDGPTLQVALRDGVHNQIMALLARGSALVLSPFPLYQETTDPEGLRYFSPDETVVLPQLPSPTEVG